MENNNENTELHSKKNYKANNYKSKIKLQLKSALGSLAKNDIYYQNTQDFNFHSGENSDLITNYEKSNTSQNENCTNLTYFKRNPNSKSSLDNQKASYSYCLPDKRLSESILQVKAIILNLRRSLEANAQIQKALVQKYEKLSEKQITIEKTLEKIKRINKSKQKKHIKYLKYTPLNKVYYYCPKKIHYYYILMDLVIKSRKKNKQILNNNFHFSLGGNNSNVSKKRDINRFKFSKKEDAVLKKNMLFSAETDCIDWADIARETQTKNAFQVFVRSLELSNFYAYKKWTSVEDNILRKAILYYGPKNWQQISYCLDGRNNSQCFHRWMKGINPKIKRNKWSFEEDLTLGVALKIYGNKKWSKIANHLNGRTDIQCRERFCNILDPNLEEVEWKSAEDIKLLSLYEKYGNKWSKIAKEFGNRTDNTCWRRWKYLISVNKSFSFIRNANSNRNNLSNNSSTNLALNARRSCEFNSSSSLNHGLGNGHHGNDSLYNFNLSVGSHNSNLVIKTPPTTNNYSSSVTIKNAASASTRKKFQSQSDKKKLLPSIKSTIFGNRNRPNYKNAAGKKNEKQKITNDISIAANDNTNAKNISEAHLSSTNNNFEFKNHLDDNASLNKNKLFATSVAKLQCSNYNNFRSPKEVFPSNKTRLNNYTKKNKNSIDKASNKTNIADDEIIENGNLYKKYLRKRPRSPSNLNNDDLNNSTHLKKRFKKQDEKEEKIENAHEIRLLGSQESQSFCEKKQIKDSNKEKKPPLRNFSTNKKVLF